MKIAPTLTLLAGLLGAGISPAFAINGTIDDANNFPFVVQVIAETRDGEETRYCSATVHSRRMLSTAANCFYHDKSGTIQDSRVEVRFKDADGIVRHTAAKPYIAKGFLPAMVAKQNSRAAGNDGGKKLDAETAARRGDEFMSQAYRAYAQDFAILLTDDDVSVPPVPATILDASMPFAGLLEKFGDPQQTWTPELVQELGGKWFGDFKKRIILETRHSGPETYQVMPVRTIGYGHHCEDADRPECYSDDSRGYATSYLSSGWDIQSHGQSLGFVFSLYKPEGMDETQILQGDLGAPIGVFGTDGTFIQIGVAVIGDWINDDFDIVALGSVLFSHVALWKEFTESAEYRAAMSVQKQAAVLEENELPILGTKQFGALAFGTSTAEDEGAVAYGLGNSPASARAIAEARCNRFGYLCGVVHEFGAVQKGAQCQYIAGGLKKGKVEWVRGSTEKEVTRSCKKRGIACGEPVGACAW
jgi:hypothetical protein